MSLSSLIVQREIASIREVEEALARQVLYGGDLVTNLLEVCRLDEVSLGAVAAEWYGLPAAPAGELPRPSSEALRALGPDVAALRSMAPLSVDRYGLVVAVAEPLTPEVEQELVFALAVPISQRLAPLVRIRQALARDYGVPLDRRLARLLGKVLGEVPRRPSGPSRVPDVTAPPRAPSPPVEPPPAPETASRPTPLPARSAGTPATLFRESGVSPPKPTKRRRGPLTSTVAQRELEEASTRDGIFDLVFEFARQYFDYTAMFTVHGDIAEGRDASGEGTSRDRIGRIGVPLDLPSVLASARVQKKPLRMVPEREGLDAVLMADLGREGGTECAVLPIVVRTRVVAVVLGDGGEGGVDPDGMGEVEAIVRQAVTAFERLIVRRKLQGTAGADASGAAPQVDREPSAPPTAEELAPPVRDLMTAPASTALPTTREPHARAAEAGNGESAPPANLLAVRRPSGPPIPREEPDVRQVSPRKSGAPRKPEAPALEFGAPTRPSLSGGALAGDEVELRLLAEIQGRDAAPPTQVTPRTPFLSADGTVDDAPTPVTPPVFAAAPAVSVAPVMSVDARGVTAPPSSPPPSGEAAPTSGEVTRPRSSRRGAASRRDRPMPASEQQISVPAHRPPSSHEDGSRVLPSIIVDVESEYGTLVARVVEDGDESAEAELLSAGAKAMPALMERFPGPITIERGPLEDVLAPRASECGPVLRLVASQRRAALPHVIERVGAKEPEVRRWATALLGELVYPEAVDAAVARAFDEEPGVRKAARSALRSLAEAHAALVVDKLGAIAKGRAESAARRTLAVEALGESREPLAVPVLASLVGDAAGSVAHAARIALVLTTRQDFGHDSPAWFAWWDEHGERHRLEWLIDALLSDSSVLRAAAGEELKAITREYFGFYDDLPKREREKVQARYRQWWADVGRVRFSRAQRP